MKTPAILGHLHFELKLSSVLNAMGMGWRHSGSDPTRESVHAPISTSSCFFAESFGFEYGWLN